MTEESDSHLKFEKGGKFSHLFAINPLKWKSTTLIETSEDKFQLTISVTNQESKSTDNVWNTFIENYQAYIFYQTDFLKSNEQATSQNKAAIFGYIIMQILVQLAAYIIGPLLFFGVVWLLMSLRSCVYPNF